MNVRPGRTILGGGGGGLTGPIPRDLFLIAASLLVTMTLSSFPGTDKFPPYLTITPDVWQRRFLWQLATYPYVEAWGPNFGFVINVILLFLWGREVYWGLGRRHFWRLVLTASIASAVLATLVHMIGVLATGWSPERPFSMLQGWTLLTILLAAWARANRGATILLFFILPIEATWMIALELLLAFIAFLVTKDLPGFVGICSAIGISWFYIARGGKIGFGKRDLREYRLRLERWWIQRKLERAKKKRGFRVVQGERGDRGGDVRKGPWVN